MMIKGHGIVTVGESIDEACINAVYMERTAKIMADRAGCFGFKGVPDDFIETLSGSKEKLLTPRRRACPTPPSGTTTPTRSRKAKPGRGGWRIELGEPRYRMSSESHL